MKNAPPTIKEIADILKVSTSTVSRALNDNQRIGIGTREKIKKLAAELGYEPNSKAIFFKQKKTNIIGVVLPKISEDFFSDAISGIEQKAMEQDFTILFGQSFDDPEREQKVIYAMCRQRVDGILISLSKDTNSLKGFEKLKLYGIPIVYFDRVPLSNNVNKVYCNLYKGTMDMIDWLFAKGMKRIGFINGPSSLIASKERFKGYMNGVAKKQIKVDMQLIEETDLSKESTQAALDRLLNLKVRPNAIITFNDYVHMDAVQHAQKNGIKVNDEILFLSYANLPITTYTAFPPIVNIEQFPSAQGVKAMEILGEIINNKKTEAIQEVECIIYEMPSTLIINPRYQNQ